MINGKIQGSSGYEEIKLAVFYQIVSVEADRFQGCRFILLLFFFKKEVQWSTTWLDFLYANFFKVTPPESVETSHAVCFARFLKILAKVNKEQIDSAMTNIHHVYPF